MYKLQLCSEILCVWYNNRVRYCLFPNKRVRVPGTDLSIQQRRGGCVYETFSGNIERERERRVYGQGAIHEGVLLCDPRRENVQLANRPLSDFFSQKISILLTTQTGCYDV